MNVRRSVANLIQNDPQLLEQYVEGVRLLKQKTRRGKTTNIYDEFVAIHIAVSTLRFDAQFLSQQGVDPTQIGGLPEGPAAGADGAHRNTAFLPWHRAYLRRLEIELQEVLQNLDFALPYWDWTDATSTQQLFTNQFLGPGNTDLNVSQGPIQTGFFIASNWPVRPDLQYFMNDSNQVDTLGTALIRSTLDFNALPQSTEITIDALGETEYDEFRIFLEGEGQRLHDYIHGWIGGSMAMMTSPNDPIFFLHHAFIDYVWAQWQRDRKTEWEADPQNQGQDYDYATHYITPSNTPHGHNIDDPMWPWDTGASQPGIYLPTQNNFPIFQVLFLNADMPVDYYSLGDRITPRTMLNHQQQGFTYDNL